MTRNILIVAALVVIVVVGYAGQNLVHAPVPVADVAGDLPDASEVDEAVNTPEMVTMTGTYVCLPLASGAAATADCAFGIRTDGGEYYAVNFGARAGSMADFRDGVRITAKGTIILTKDLNPNNWEKFTSKGLFTILEKEI